MGLLDKKKKSKPEIKPQEAEPIPANIGDAPKEETKPETVSVGTLNHNEAWLLEEIRKCYSGIETLIIEMQDLKKWLQDKV